MIRHSQAWSRRRIDPPHARSLIFSSPLYCIGASDHLASITAFMSDCLLLRLRLTLHDPPPPLHPSVIAIRSVCPCHSLDSCVSSFHWKQCVNKPTSHELPSLFYFSRFFPKHCSPQSTGYSKTPLSYSCYLSWRFVLPFIF